MWKCTSSLSPHFHACVCAHVTVQRRTLRSKSKFLCPHKDTRDSQPTLCGKRRAGLFFTLTTWSGGEGRYSSTSAAIGRTDVGGNRICTWLEFGVWGFFSFYVAGNILLECDLVNSCSRLAHSALRWTRSHLVWISQCLYFFIQLLSLCWLRRSHSVPVWPHPHCAR